MIIIRNILLVWCTFLSTALTAATLTDVTVKPNPKITTVLLRLVGSASPHVFTLTHPDRVVIDFNRTTTRINPQRIVLGSGLVAAIRTGNPNAQTLRMVLDVKQSVKPRMGVWRVLGKDQGLQLTLTPMYTASSKGYTPHVYNPPPSRPLHPSLPTVSKASSKASLSSLKPIAAQHAPRQTLRDVVIVLDPGHGGKDPGAMGPGRIAEKNVVLAIALRLKQLIDRQPGMHAVLTRQGDYYLGLRQRLDIARKYNADIFVSIHADAFINHESSGASVFALSQTGATSEAARWLAEKENYSELGGVNFSSLDDRLVRTVLLDLSQTATIGASLNMGGRVLRHLDQMTRLHNNKVEQARFVVLKSPDIPSILIETGFISNPREARNLTSPAYQTRLTQAIFSGIKGYFWEYPPQGTRVEMLSGGNTRLVRL